MHHDSRSLVGANELYLEALTTLQVKTILVAMATKILELATELELKSPVWRLKLSRKIESVSLI